MGLCDRARRSDLLFDDRNRGIIAVKDGIPLAICGPFQEPAEPGSAHHDDSIASVSSPRACARMLHFGIAQNLLRQTAAGSRVYNIRKRMRGMALGQEATGRKSAKNLLARAMQALESCPNHGPKRQQDGVLSHWQIKQGAVSIDA